MLADIVGHDSIEMICWAWDMHSIIDNCVVAVSVLGNLRANIKTSHLTYGEVVGS